MSGELQRRDFFRLSAGALASAAAAPNLRRLFGGTSAEAEAVQGRPGPSMLSVHAKDAPIDHVVVLMMENRSFDHYLGWLANDGEFIDEGLRRYGRRFHVDGDQRQRFPRPDGSPVETYHLPTKPGETNPYRGCDHPDPGHGWVSGRAQRDGGFLADGSKNDELALGYFRAEDVPLYAMLVRRFTTFDRFHCSLLGPTFPNRHYLHCAQSGAIKSNDIPRSPSGFEWPTIWEKLRAAGVPAAQYSVDLPSLALYGIRMAPFVRHIEDYFADCALGTLPNVTFLDPGFTTGLRTDDHPHADIRSGQKYVFDVFKAFAESPLWERGMFVITYDEWGGFFDHVPPPVLPDNRSRSNDAENFGQAGFRVPTIVASPYARPGFVDHRLYDHTSIMRFIEWRFLGAPPEGGGGAGWYLTKRDRYARNLGWSLMPNHPQPDVDLELLLEIPIASRPCDGDALSGIPGVDDLPPAGDKHAFEVLYETGYFERAGFKIDLRRVTV